MMSRRIHLVIADLTPDRYLIQQNIIVHFLLDIGVELGDGKDIL